MGSLRRFGIVAGVAVLAGGLVACSGAPGPTTRGSPGASAAAGLPDLGLKTVTTEAGAARGATVGPEGATITSAGANGVTYTLTVPRGAVDRSIAVGLYPVTSLSNLPQGATLMAGVQFVPDGLQLHAAATLTIQLPAGADLSKVSGLAWRGDGVGEHLQPAIVEGSTVRITVLHFSGAGAVSNGSFQGSCVLGTEGQAAYYTCLADKWQGQVEIDAGQPDARTKLLADLKAWYSEGVEPALSLRTANGNLSRTDEQPLGNAYGAWLYAITFAGQVVHDPAFTVAPEVEQARNLAYEFLAEWYDFDNGKCLEHRGDADPGEAILWADFALTETSTFVDLWGLVAASTTRFDLESLLDDLCVKVVIDPGRSYSATQPGAKGKVKIKVGFTIGVEPPRTGPNAINVRVSFAGETSALAEGQADANGEFDVPDVTWPSGADPLRIDIRANLQNTAIAAVSNPGANLITAISRFDRITKSSKPSRIAFTSDRNGGTQIWVMDGDRSHETQLTHDTPGRRSDTPAWSPDGTKIAFASSRDGGEYQLYVMNADGSNPVRLTPGDAINIFPTWSPDGSRIAFMQFDHAAHKTQRIAVVAATGGPIIELTAPAAGADFHPSWSPDGTRVAFSSNRTGVSQIYVVEVQSRIVTQLTPTAGTVDSRNPSWSPDGNRLVFVRFDGHYSIQVMDASGQNVSPVYRDILGETYPAWTPDGRIAFTKPVPSTAGGEATVVQAIFVVDVDGSNLELISPTDSSNGMPAWSR